MNNSIIICSIFIILFSANKWQCYQHAKETFSLVKNNKKKKKKKKTEKNYLNYNSYYKSVSYKMDPDDDLFPRQLPLESLYWWERQRLDCALMAGKWWGWCERCTFTLYIFEFVNVFALVSIGWESSRDCACGGIP